MGGKELLYFHKYQSELSIILNVVSTKNFENNFIIFTLKANIPNDPGFQFYIQLLIIDINYYTLLPISTPFKYNINHSA